MKVKLNTDICPIITPDTYGTGFQYNIADEMWEDFKTNVLCKYAAQYIKDTIKDSKIFGSCPVNVEMELHSPSFYNYGTDWINFDINLSDEALSEIENLVNSDPKFYRFIEKFGSHSGFISHYPTTEEECKKVFNEKSDKFPLLVAEAILYDLRNFNLEEVQDDFIDDVMEFAAGNGYEVDEEDMEESKQITEETGDNSFYKVVYGYQMAIVRTDWPTTDYGAVVDILIDGLEKEGVGEPYLLPLDQAEQELNEDEYVVGGNHGLALVHNGNFNIEPIPEQDAKRYEKNDHITIYSESKQIKEGTMKKNVNSIVDNILAGKSILESIMEGAGRLVSVKIVDEPYGKGVEVKDSNGAVYKYVVDVNDPKYYTPEKVLHAVQGLARRYNNDMGKIYNFLKQHTVDYYDKDLTNRAGLASVDIVAEPNGEGLKVTLDNGQVYRYTVDTSDPKYGTLEDLKNGAEGMWRHGATIDGIIKFLDAHAMLYAHESKELESVRKALANYLLENADVKVELSWVKEAK